MDKMIPIELKLQPELIARLDAFRHGLPVTPSRSEVIRSFIRDRLAQLETHLEKEKN